MARGPSRLRRWPFLIGALLAVAGGIPVLPPVSAFADEPPTPPPPPQSAPPEGPTPAPDAPPAPPAAPDAPAVPAAPTPAPDAPPTPEAPPAAEPPAAEPPAPAAPATVPEAPPTPAPAPTPPPVAPGEARGAPPFAPAPVLAPCDPCRSSRRWTVRMEGGVTLLSDLDGRLGEGVPPATPELSWDGVDYDPALAARVGFEVALTDCSALEFGFTWYGSFEADGERATGAFGFAPPPGGVSPQYSVSLDADAEVYGARVAWWRTFSSSRCLTAQVGAGGRWIHFHEEGDATDWQTVTGATAELSGDATDDLLAALLGVRLAFHPSDCWTIGVAGEAFGGWMHRNVSVHDTAVFSAGSHSSSLEEDDFSWGFELELSVKRALSPQFAVRGSVGVLYLADVNRLDSVFDFGQAATGVVQARNDGREAWIPNVFLGFELTF